MYEVYLKFTLISICIYNRHALSIFMWKSAALECRKATLSRDCKHISAEVPITGTGMCFTYAGQSELFRDSADFMRDEKTFAGQIIIQYIISFYYKFNT